jgi:hypothetical protein
MRKKRGFGQSPFLRFCDLTADEEARGKLNKDAVILKCTPEPFNYMQRFGAKKGCAAGDIPDTLDRAHP